MKMKKLKVKWSWVAAIIILVVVVLIVSVYVSVGSKYSKVMAKGLALPAAFVGSKEVSLADYQQRLEILSKVPGNVRDEGSVSKDEEKKLLLQKMIENKVAEITANREKINITDAEINKTFQYRKEISGQDKLGEKYGISDEDFKKIFSEPETLNNKLGTALASDSNLNANALKKLKDAKARLAAGDTFEEVASAFSDDEASAKIGGDIGFISESELPQEYFEEVRNAKDGKVHFVATRYGLYLFEVLDKDNSGPNHIERYHVKQIFIKTTDYDKWLQDEVKKYKIIELV